jgi:hypothetical protein
MDKTVEQKTAIAEGWRTSGLRQADYASEHGISDRTLRLWLAKYAPPPPQTTGHILTVLLTAMKSLHRLYRSMGIDPVEVLGTASRPPIPDARPAPIPMPRVL